MQGLPCRDLYSIHITLQTLGLAGWTSPRVTMGVAHIDSINLSSPKSYISKSSCNSTRDIPLNRVGAPAATQLGNIGDSPEVSRKEKAEYGLPCPAWPAKVLLCSLPDLASSPMEALSAAPASRMHSDPFHVPACLRISAHLRWWCWQLGGGLLWHVAVGCSQMLKMSFGITCF